ncbi:hypothetical protein IWQ60_002951 [Tieghemiomyces parasiticus]|uniref:Nudix hydrolase domain-containing protein n=1 Tax=Tieghemiomyces parasiticus TaxID=78921 RepID=A0A9W7ZVK7_9FUNG|nr:hypothetical protein IWQ60_010070 [Tieghemiomyces parasiticus]KAJ1927401.1 hypothetical protein IWQ60_002951 [Tieghemiomyces parasiticus]
MGEFANLLEVCQACDNVTYPFTTKEYPTEDERPVPFTFRTVDRDQERLIGYIDAAFVPAFLRTAQKFTSASDVPFEFFTAHRDTPETHQPVELEADSEPLLGVGEYYAKVLLANHLKSFEERTRVFHQFILALRASGFFPCLEGWRNEQLPVYGEDTYPKRAAFTMERAATPIFGIMTYGVHVNGYHRTPDGALRMWIARRSATKPTYPSMLDNVVAGGITFGDGVLGSVIKECHEEASLPATIAMRAQPVGTVTYYSSTVRGMQPEVQFAFDLEIPADYPLRPCDGEVQAFYLMDMDELRAKLLAGEFKPNSALLAIDFMVRHALITPENEPDYLEIIASLHRSPPFPGPSFAS